LIVGLCFFTTSRPNAALLWPKTALPATAFRPTQTAATDSRFGAGLASSVVGNAGPRSAPDSSARARKGGSCWRTIYLSSIKVRTPRRAGQRLATCRTADHTWGALGPQHRAPIGFRTNQQSRRSCKRRPPPRSLAQENEGGENVQPPENWRNLKFTRSGGHSGGFVGHGRPTVPRWPVGFKHESDIPGRSHSQPKER